MTIQPLSDATSRVLTSTQTLNTATSVVKELIDNALDARASSISIEISANTLDKIIVKDDGFGIGIQDRQMLCKRGCTSKIANLDDLANLGGTFLGFRGTALASVAELSKEVTIITKVEGEQPATTMTFGPNGQLLSSSSSSHNDGTTVRVENFLASVPVRRQVVLKNPSKILEDIKKLLHSYALARPGVKLLLKVLKAKNDKGNWSFASCRGDDVLSAAAVQVVGKPIASLCTSHDIRSNHGDSDCYRMKSLLLGAGDNDLSKAGNIGQFVSVDGRPVSSEKGVMKDLVKKYKTYLQNANTSDKFSPSKPFIVIHLRCPDGSYDVNVEPAKDVVLFHNQSDVLDLADKLFIDVYGGLGQQEQSDGSIQAVNSAAVKRPVSFDTLLARKTKPELTAHKLETLTNQSKRDNDDVSDNLSIAATPQASLIQEFAKAINQPQTTQHDLLSSEDTASSTPHLARDIPRRNMYAIDDETPTENEILGMAEEFLEGEEIYDPEDITVNNPFTRAKAYSLQRPGRAKGSGRQSSSTNSNSRATISLNSESSDLATSPAIQRVSFNTVYRLPTPVSSPRNADSEAFQNPGPPFPRRNKNRNGINEEHGSFSDQDSEAPRPQSRQRQAGLSEWAKSSPSDGRHSFRSALGLTDQHPLPSRDPLPDHSLESDLQPTLKQRPFRPPFKQTPTKSTADNSQQLIGRPSPTSHLNTSVTDRILQNDADLQHILEFEQRKRSVNQRQKFNQAKLNPADLARLQQASRSITDHARTSEGTSPVDKSTKHTSFDSVPVLTSDPHTTKQSPRSQSTNPHQNRYLAAKRHLQTPTSPNPASTLLSLTSSAMTEQNQTDLTTNQPQHKSAFDPTDPRGYYISHLHHNTNSDSNLTTTTTNPSSPHQIQPAKRVKSSRLPFETIPSNIQNHNLSLTFSEHIDLTTVSTRADNLNRHDTYIKHGTINSIDWSNTDLYQTWQDRVQELVKLRYTPNQDESNERSVQPGNNKIGEETEIDLARSIQMHVSRLERPTT